MNLQEAIKVLVNHNDWRRANEDTEMQDPKEIGKAIDVVVTSFEETKHSLEETLWMARRYADGRQTYAPRMFNDAYNALRNIYGEIDYNAGDHTLTKEGKYYPYAADGDERMRNELPINENWCKKCEQYKHFCRHKNHCMECGEFNCVCSLK